MTENITKIREIEENTIKSVDFINYLSKKTINSLLDEKTIENFVKSHILVL